MLHARGDIVATTIGNIMGMYSTLYTINSPQLMAKQDVGGSLDALLSDHSVSVIFCEVWILDGEGLVS